MMQYPPHNEGPEQTHQKLTKFPSRLNFRLEERRFLLFLCLTRAASTLWIMLLYLEIGFSFFVSHMNTYTTHQMALKDP